MDLLQKKNSLDIKSDATEKITDLQMFGVIYAPSTISRNEMCWMCISESSRITGGSQVSSSSQSKLPKTCLFFFISEKYIFHCSLGTKLDMEKISY